MGQLVELGLVEVGAGLVGVAVDAGRGGSRAACRMCLVLQGLLAGAGCAGGRSDSRPLPRARRLDRAVVL